MQNYSLAFHFSWDSTLDFTTTDIVIDSIKVTEQRFNNLRSSSSTVSLDIFPDSGLLYQRLLRSNEGDIQAQLSAEGDVIFTGYVSRNLTWEVSVTGSSPVAITIESTGTRKLQKKLAQEDGVCIYDTPYNIISNVCNFCGLTFNDSGIDSTSDPALYVNVLRKIDRNQTCEDLLDDLLYEIGYVDWFDAYGQLSLQKIDLDQAPAQITEDDLYEVQGNALSLSSQARQYTAASVKYSEMRTRQNVNVYQVDTSSNYIVLDNISNLWWDGEYHDITETPAPATVDMTDIDAGQTILWFDPTSLMATVHPALPSQAADPAPTLQLHLTPDTSYPYRTTDKVDVLIDNTTALKLVVAYDTFKAQGTAATIDENTIMTAKDGSFTGSEYEYEYETSWIHDKDRAEALAVRLSKYNLYCNSTYNFYTKENLALGSLVTVTDTTFAHAQVTLFLTGRTYTHYWFQDEPCYRYTGQAVSSLISQYIPSTARSSSKTQYMPQSFVYIRYSEYADGHDMVENPTAATKYIGTYTGPSASCPSYTAFKWSQYATDEPQVLNVEVNPSNLIQNRRLTGSQPIEVICYLSGYTDTPVISYWFDDNEDDTVELPPGATAIINVPYNNTYSSMTVHVELTGADPVDVVLETIDRTEEYGWFGHMNIDTQAYFPGGIFDPTCWDQVDWTDIENELPAGQQFLNKDSFFNEFTAGDFTDVYIYVFFNGVWTPITYVSLSDREKSVICARAQKAVLSTIEPGTVTKSDFGYFNDIIAGTVTANFIGSKEIEVQDGGFIYAGDVDITKPAGQRVGTTGAGFCFDSIGNSELSNIRITGNSTIEGESTILGTIKNYDQGNAPVFETVKDVPGTGDMAGSKVDGTDGPNAYVWSEFTTWLRNWILNHATSGTTYTTTTPRTMYGYWNGSSISSKTVTGIKYWSSLPARTSNTVYGSTGYNSSETNTVMYTNNSPYAVKFQKITVHPKSKDRVGTTTGYGRTKVTVRNSSGGLYNTLYNYGQGADVASDFMDKYCYYYNVVVPPNGGYILVDYADPYNGSWQTGGGTNLYLTFVLNEGDFMYEGINLVVSGGTVYPFDTVFPDYGDYSTYPQRLTCSGLSLNLDMQMGSSGISGTWPVEKLYRFGYTTSPVNTAPVSTSIFDSVTGSKVFSYRGSSKNVVSITYSSTSLKVTDDIGVTYEFSTATGNYYPQHTFSFKTLDRAKGAYATSVLPIDDSGTHNIGGSADYSSGNPQRWDTGFFHLINADIVNADWNIAITSTSTTIAEMEAGQMRPFYVPGTGVSGQTLTMPSTPSSAVYRTFAIRDVGIETQELAAGATSNAYRTPSIVFVVRLS